MDYIMTPAGSYTPARGAPIRHVNIDFAAPASQYAPLRLTQYDSEPIIAAHLYYGGSPYTVPEGAAVNIRLRKHDGQPVYDPAIGVSEDRQTAYIQVTGQMTAAAGMAAAVIEVITSDVKVAGTARAEIDVERNPVQETDIISSAEYKVLVEYVADASAAAKRAEAAAEQTAEDKRATSELAEQAAGSAGAAADSATAAAGSAQAADADKLAAESARIAAAAAALLAQSWARGETGSRDGEDKDNAMYYAAQALIAALHAAESAEDAQRVAQGAIGYYETPELLRKRHPDAEDGNWAIVGSTDTIWVWDSDTTDWTDSGNKTDLSLYYTKDEIDDILSGITPEAIGALPITGGTATGSIYLRPVAGTGNFGIYRDGNLVINMSASANGGSYSTNMTDGTEAVRVYASADGGVVALGGKNRSLTQVMGVTADGKTRVVADEVIGASKLYTVTVPASGWKAAGSPAPTWNGKTAKWVNTVSVPGTTETANIPQGCVSFTSGSYAAAGQWTWLEQGTDTVTFYSDGAAAPAADFVLRLTEVK